MGRSARGDRRVRARQGRRSRISSSCLPRSSIAPPPRAGRPRRRSPTTRRAWTASSSSPPTRGSAASRSARCCLLARAVIERSLREGFDLAPFEALWKRTPGGGGLPLAIRDGVDGFLAPDTEQAAAHILELVRDPGLAVEMGRAGRERVREQFLVTAALERELRALAIASKPDEGLPSRRHRAGARGRRQRRRCRARHRRGARPRGARDQGGRGAAGSGTAARGRREHRDRHPT